MTWVNADQNISLTTLSGPFYTLPENLFLSFELVLFETNSVIAVTDPNLLDNHPLTDPFVNIGPDGRPIVGNIRPENGILYPR